MITTYTPTPTMPSYCVNGRRGSNLNNQRNISVEQSRWEKAHQSSRVCQSSVPTRATTRSPDNIDDVASERMASERMASEWIVSQRIVSERIVSERWVSERIESACAGLGDVAVCVGVTGVRCGAGRAGLMRCSTLYLASRRRNDRGVSSFNDEWWTLMLSRVLRRWVWWMTYCFLFVEWQMR